MSRSEQSRVAWLLWGVSCVRVWGGEGAGGELMVVSRLESKKRATVHG